MDPQDFRQQLDGLHGVLAAQDPDPARSDWGGIARPLDSVIGACEWLLDNHEHIESISDNETTARRVRIHVAESCAHAAALLYAAMRMKQAKAILERAAAICPDYGDEQLYRAGVIDLEAFCKAIRASWLFKRGQHDQARKLAATLRAAPQAIAEFARFIERAPTPVDSAPASFSLNGFGLRFYGGYDPEPDGSEVRVRFVTALFVPVVPIDAYRMRDHGDGYLVHGKVGLGPLMRAWKYGALGLIAAAVIWGLVSSYLDSPERRLRKEIDEVAALEHGDPDAALERYEALVAEYLPQLEGDEGQDELLRIAQAWVPLATAKIPNPITPAAVDQVSGVVARYAALPGRMHEGELSNPFVDQLLGWVDALGFETPAHANASLDLLGAAGRFASPSRSERVADGVRATRIALARQLAVDWPLEAVRQYGRLLDDGEAREAMQQVLAELPRTPTLLVDVADEIRAFAGTNPSDAELARTLVATVEQGEALTTDPERLQLLESADEAGLRAALEVDPGDQVIAVALADVLRGRGELDAAVALLNGLGKPGLLTHDAQFLLASLASEQGRLDDAAHLLEQMLDNRLPAFEDARRAYDTEFEQLRDRLINQAEQGNIPTKYSAITSEDVEVARRAFGEWLEAEIARSPLLPRLQSTYMRQADIVPVAVLLGTVQLQRARAVAGDERQQLLDSAEATFLAIRSEAGGMPNYHMSLGQVYHRLGKIAEGDAEFQVLIDDPDANVQLLAVSGYRELGQFARARELSEAIYERGDQAAKHRAAVLRSLLATDIDERQTWLERGDPADEFVKTSLLELEGDRLLRDGKFAAADAKYAEAFELYEARAEREHSSFNNAALALLSRHACTGNVAHVDAALELMKASVAMTPDDGIVLNNYANVLEFRAALELLDRFVSTKGLRIGTYETETLLQQLYISGRHDEFVAAVRDAPRRARSLEVNAQLETLAPQMPGPYVSQAKWYVLADNDEGMVKLVARLRETGSLDTSDAAQAYLDDLAGAGDEQALAARTVALEARAAIRDQAKRASPATRAVLLQLDGEDLVSRARLHGLTEQGRADIHAAVEAYEQAQRLWPSGLSADGLSDALTLVAVHEVASEMPELGSYWAEHIRADGTAFVLLGLLERGDPAVAALVEHPAFRRSLELRRGLEGDALDVLDLAVAKLAGDEELRARTVAVLATPRRRTQLEFAVLIAPYDDASARALELVAAEQE